MLTLTSWLEKSRYRLPSKSQTSLPRPPAMTTGSRVACADQEWNTCSRSSRLAVSFSVVIGVVVIVGSSRAGDRAGDHITRDRRHESSLRLVAALLQLDLEGRELLAQQVDLALLAELVERLL